MLHRKITLTIFRGVGLMRFGGSEMQGSGAFWLCCCRAARWSEGVPVAEVSETERR